MRIKGIDQLSAQEIQDEVNAGGKFVYYTYCFSLIVITFKRSTPIFFVKSNENAFAKSLPYTLLTFVLGWWGIPWGIIYTVGCLITNIKGGKNVTEEVMQSIYRRQNRSVFEFEQQDAISAQ